MTPNTPSPNLSDLLTRPREFFMALRGLPPRNGRYLWLVLLTGLLTALYTLLTQRPVQAAMEGIPGIPGGAFSLVIGGVGAVILMLLMWLLLWGLGSLGAGREGRAAEVFGAAFLPSALISLILLPLAALFPLQVNIPPPNWGALEGQELATAIQKYSGDIQRQVGRQPLAVIGNVLGYAGMAWQFYLAFIGFGVLTGDRGRALKGVLIPLGVFLLLGGAFWLLGRAASSMMGGGA